jgi:predicted GIY-YIG superfamily endonuclease
MTTAETWTAEYDDGTTYLLHFDRPYKHAKHYVGSTRNLAQRLAEHTAGRGARLTQVVRDAGISWRLARTWPGLTETERDIKARRNTPAMCPACTPNPWPGTGHRKPPEDLSARREAAAFLGGVRSAETWAAPVLAAGRVDEARKMLALEYHPMGRQDAERQRGFTAQLAAMIRQAEPQPQISRPRQAADDTPTRKEPELRDNQETAAQLRAKAGAEGTTPAEAAAMTTKATAIEAKHPTPAPAPKPASAARPDVAPLTGMTLAEALFGTGRSDGYARQAAPPPAPAPVRQALPGGCDHEAGE